MKENLLKANPNLIFLKMELWQKAGHGQCTCPRCHQILMPWQIKNESPIFVCNTLSCGYSQKCPDSIVMADIAKLVDHIRKFSKPKTSALVYTESADDFVRVKKVIEETFPEIDFVFGLTLPLPTDDLLTHGWHSLMVVCGGEEIQKSLVSHGPFGMTSMCSHVPTILITENEPSRWFQTEFVLSPTYFGKAGFKHYVPDIRKLITEHIRKNRM